MKNNVKIFIIVGLILIIFIIFVVNKKSVFSDTINYNKKKYVYLEINNDVFYYQFYNNDNYYLEVDKISKINHDKWDMIYLSGDLFVYEKDVKKALEYYKDDNNYKWTVIIEEDEIEYEFPILIGDDELKYLYNIESIEKEETMLFEEIEKFGTIKKVSKDKMVYSIMCLAKFNDNWYYRTSIIDITNENDPEYVIRLPESLNNKIKELEGDL